jgi:TolB-like protein
VFAPVLALVLCAATVDTVSLAAPGLKLSNLKATLAEPLNEHLALQLTAKGFKTITSADIAAVLGFERQKQLLGCTEESSACTAEMAGAMGVDGIVQGSVVRLGKRFQVTVKVISGQDGSSLASSSETGDSDEKLFDALTRVAEKLAEQLRAVMRERPKRVTVVDTRPEVPSEARHTAEASVGARRWWWVPASIGVGLVIGATASFLQASEATRLLRAPPAPGFDARATLDRGETGATLGWILTGAAVAAAVTTVAFVVFGEPSPVQLSGWVSGSGGALTARWELP